MPKSNWGYRKDKTMKITQNGNETYINGMEVLGYNASNDINGNKVVKAFLKDGSHIYVKGYNAGNMRGYDRFYKNMAGLYSSTLKRKVK
jgi:hypothetical protein